MANQVQIKFDGDSRQLIQSTARISENMDAILGRMEKMERKKVGKEVASDMTVAIAKMVSFRAVIDLARSGLERLNEVRNKAAQDLKEPTFELGQLAQISGGSLPKFQQLKQMAFSTSAQAGIPIGEAGQAVFNLQSIGSLDALQTLVQMRQSATFKDPFTFGEDITGIINAVGQGETGGFRGVINKVLAAAKESPLSAGQISPFIRRASSTAQAFGMDDETLMATVAAGALVDSPERATTRIIGFLNKANQGVAKGGIDAPKGDMFAVVKNINEQLKAGTEIFKIFPDIEAQQGFGIVSGQIANIRKFRDRIRQAQAGTGPGDALDRMMGLTAGDVDIAPAQAARMSAQARTVLEAREFGPGRLRSDALIDQTMAAASDRGDLAMSRFAREQGLKLVRFLAGDENMSRSSLLIGEREEATQLTGSISRLGGVKLNEQQTEILEKQLETLNRIEDRLNQGAAQ
tara:strand:+ start:1759 stop:3147 length:1389 start_codon:yes stop_codon:yes gene_type:complete